MARFASEAGMRWFRSSGSHIVSRAKILSFSRGGAPVGQCRPHCSDSVCVDDRFGYLVGRAGVELGLAYGGSGGPHAAPGC